MKKSSHVLIGIFSPAAVLAKPASYTDGVDPGTMRESVIAQIARSAYDYMLYVK